MNILSRSGKTPHPLRMTAQQRHRRPAGRLTASLRMASLVPPCRLQVAGLRPACRPCPTPTFTTGSRPVHGRLSAPFSPPGRPRPPACRVGAQALPPRQPTLLRLTRLAFPKKVYYDYPTGPSGFTSDGKPPRGRPLERDRARTRKSDTKSTGRESKSFDSKHSPSSSSVGHPGFTRVSKRSGSSCSI